MKIVLVTGGTSGIGLEAVLRFAEQGEQVVTCSRNSADWAKLVDQNATLATVDYHQVDISNEQQVADMFIDIKAQYGKLDIAINNASPAIEAKGRFAGLDKQKLQHTLMNDFWAHSVCIHWELNLMNEGGSIVNVSSVNGQRAAPNAAMYSAAKHGIEGLTKSVALEAIKEGIRINSVAPGVTWTTRWEKRAKAQPELKEQVAKSIPIERAAKTSEIVDAIEFLSSEKASYIVGHTLTIDGGLSLC